MTIKTVTLFRGLPASGKTTRANQILAEDPHAVRLNNDDLVKMLRGRHASSSHSGPVPHPAMLSQLRLRTLEVLLDDQQVSQVLIDNTNLAAKTVKSLHTLTMLKGHRFIVDDTFLDTPWDELVRRDTSRDASVGEDVMRTMQKQASRVKPFDGPDSFHVEPAPAHNPGLPSVFVFDLDGTLAIHEGIRNSYDYTAVLEDRPNLPIVYIAKTLIATNQRIIFMSGRDDSCLGATQAWLQREVHLDLDFRYNPIFMRATGDKRPDFMVKADLYNRHVRGVYNVIAVFDDRDQVVRLWRDRLHIPTLQVANGNF